MVNDIDISARLRKILSPDFVNRLVTSADLADLASFVETTIKLRTAQGRYVNQANKSYAKGYIKKRAVKGLQTSHVDMFFSGETLDAIKSTVETTSRVVSLTNPIVQVGYIEGKSEQRALRIAGYHNVSGAGPKKVIRRFIGLTADERKKVIDMINQKIAARTP